MLVVIVLSLLVLLVVIVLSLLVLLVVIVLSLLVLLVARTPKYFFLMFCGPCISV